jgi:hypothetical protein
MKHRSGKKTVKTGLSILFMAHEQLISKSFNNLTKDGGEFMAWLYAVIVDETHLFNT